MESSNIRTVTINKQVLDSEYQDPLVNERYYQAEELMSFVKENRDRIKIVSNGSKVVEQIHQIHDISLSAKGPQEDKIFLQNPSIQKNIRRGNTLLQLNDGRMIWGRKGMNKFFDFNPDWIKEQNSNQRDKNDKLYLLGPIQQCFKEGKQVTILKTLKANGENAQISYCSQLQVWIIASKNVSLVAKEERDVERYNDDRHHYSQLIAYEWFFILSNFSEEELSRIKEYLSGKTLIGEYIGNQDYQHLIKYERQTIMFYAIVDNNSSSICQPLSNSRSFLTFIKTRSTNRLDKVTSIILGTCNSLTDLLDKMIFINKEVSEARINQDEEGCVLYFFEHYEQEQEKVIGMCKLKTLEYRIFRKLREKLRNYSEFINFKDPNASPSKKLQQFKNETEELCQQFNPPRPLDFYFSFASKAFETLSGENYIHYNSLLNDRYVDFVQAVMKNMQVISEEEINNFFKSKELHTPNQINTVEGQELKDNQNGHKAHEVHHLQGLIIIAPPFVLDTATLKEELQDQIDYQEMFALQALKFKLNHFYIIVASRLDLQIQNFKQVEIIKYKTDDQGIQQSLDYILTNQMSLLQNASLFQFHMVVKTCRNQEQGFKYLKGVINSSQKVKQIDRYFQEKQQLIDYIKALLATRRNHHEEEKEESKQLVLSIPEVLSPRPQTEQSAWPFTSKNVILTLGIPGMGKSTSIKILKQILPSFGITTIESISTDEVRLEMMENYLKQNKGASKEKAFQMVEKKAKDGFDKRITQKLKLMGDSSVLVIDKNHIPNNINKSVSFIKKFQPSASVIALTNKFTPQEENLPLFPFKVDTVVQSLLRVLQRGEEHTLNAKEDPIKAIKVFFMFLKGFFRVKFDQTFLDHYSIDSFLQVNSTIYLRESLVEKRIAELIDNILKQTRPPDYQPQCTEELNELHQYLKENATMFDVFDFDFEKECARLQQEFQQLQNSIQKQEINSRVRQVTHHPEVPLLIGLKVTDTVKVTQFIEDSISKLSPKHSSMAAQIHQYLESFTYVQDFHLTMLFMNKNVEYLNHDIYQSFNEDKVININLSMLLVVGDKLVVAPVFLDPASEVKSQNRFPHITLMANKFKPKQSNDVLEILFDEENGKLKDLLNVLEKPKDNLAKMMKITIQGEAVDLFIVQLGQVTVQGKMTKYQ